MLDNKKISYISENDLKSHIKSGVFKNCYVIFGEEQFAIKSYIKKMTKTAVNTCEEFNIDNFDGAVKVQQIFDSAEAFPMMGGKKAVIICDFPFDKVPSSEADKFIAMLSEIPSTTLLILWYETVEINSKKPGEKYSKLFKAVNESGGAVCYLGHKTEGEIIRILQSGAAKRKCRMETSTARYMIRTCSEDLNTLINELEKLCLYVGEEGVITDKIIDKVCSRSVEASIYNISKAIMKGDLDTSFKIIDDLLYMNTEPEYILTVLGSSYVDLYRALAAKIKGITPNDAAKEFSYGNVAFRMSEADRNLRKFTEKQIVQSLKSIYNCDRKIKGSRVDKRVCLEKVLVELDSIARGRKI